MSNQELVKQLVTDGVLKSPHLIDAFQHINRADFVPKELADQAYINAPLPLGFGQTISQPLTVAFMLELLQPAPGDNILDIGSGSGWQTALLACLVGPAGKITALEIVPELYEQSIKNISRYDFIKRGAVRMLCANATAGLAAAAPFDKIIAAAELAEIPPAWLNQLKIGGRLVAPIGHSLTLIIKKGEGQLDRREFPGFVFVPFVTS